REHMKADAIGEGLTEQSMKCADRAARRHALHLLVERRESWTSDRGEAYVADAPSDAGNARRRDDPRREQRAVAGDGARCDEPLSVLALAFLRPTSAPHGALFVRVQPPTQVFRQRALIDRRAAAFVFQQFLFSLPTHRRWPSARR